MLHSSSRATDNLSTLHGVMITLVPPGPLMTSVPSRVPDDLSTHMHAMLVPNNSASNISLSWNLNFFSFVEPCDLKSCTPAVFMPLKVNGVGVIRFCLGSYVDHGAPRIGLGQRHPLDMVIPSACFVPESSFNILCTTHIKRDKMFLNT